MPIRRSGSVVSNLTPPGRATSAQRAELSRSARYNCRKHYNLNTLQVCRSRSTDLHLVAVMPVVRVSTVNLVVRLVRTARVARLATARYLTARNRALTVARGTAVDV